MHFSLRCKGRTWSIKISISLNSEPRRHKNPGHVMKATLARKVKAQSKSLRWSNKNKVKKYRGKFNFCKDLQERMWIRAIKSKVQRLLLNVVKCCNLRKGTCPVDTIHLPQMPEETHGNKNMLI